MVQSAKFGTARVVFCASGWATVGSVTWRGRLSYGWLTSSILHAIPGIRMEINLDFGIVQHSTTPRARCPR